MDTTIAAPVAPANSIAGISAPTPPPAPVSGPQPFASAPITPAAVPPPTPVTTVNSSLTTPTTAPIPVPTGNTSSSAQNSLGAALAAFGANLKTLSETLAQQKQDAADNPTQPTAPAGSLTDTLKQMLGLNATLATKGAETDRINAAAGIDQKTQQVQALTDQYNSRQQYYDNLIKAAQTNNPEGKDATAIQAQVDQLTRQKNSELADIAIQHSAATGDLSTATTLAQQKINAEFEPIQAQIDNLKSYYSLSQNDMTESEKMQAQAAITEKQSQLDEQKQMRLISYKAQIDAAASGGNGPGTASTSQTYTLAAGDDPYNIAQSNGTDMATLQKLNPNVQDWHNLPVGTKLNLPLPAGQLSTDPTVDSYAQGILSGSVSSIAQVPKQYKNAVQAALSNPGQNGYSPLASSRFTMAANRIVNNYIALPQYQLTANGLPYLQRIDAAIKTPGSVSDQDLLDSLTKLNTAGNAVTDAQVKVITGGKSFSDAMSVFGNKLGNGGVLSNNQRQQIVKIANAVYANYKTGYQPVYDQAVSQLKASGIPKPFWTIPDLNTLNAGEAGGQGAPAPATGTTRLTGPDGKLYDVPNEKVTAFKAAGGH